MQDVRTRLRRLALVCLLGLGAAACDDPAGPAVTVAVTPSGVVDLSVGDTVTVRAVVRDARQPGVRFSSSDPAVASVHESTGLLRALAVGEATVTATSVADPDASATVRFRVQDLPSSVLIEQILDSSGDLVDHTGARGNINVQLVVEVGSATRLEVLIDTAVACVQSFGAQATSRASAPTTCPINTAQFDPVTGVPRFMNGPAVVHARLVGADGGVRHQSNGFSIVLANPNALVSQVLAPKQATDAAGLRWVDGDLTVTALPVIFDREVGIAQATFSYDAPGGRTLTRVDTSVPFSVVFEEDSLANVTRTDWSVTITTATTAGESGPSLVTTGIRYDNQPPRPGAVAPRDWIGADVAFASTYLPAEDPDRGGVGRVQARFFAGDPILSDTALVTRGRLVTRGADLQPGGFGAYRVAALVCDALENCVPTEGFSFGVDLSAPTVEEVSVDDRAVNPEGNLVLRLQDDLSGFAPRSVEASVLSLDANPATAECGPGVDGLDLPGRQVNGACLPDTIGSQAPLPVSAPGYYTYSLTPFDRAGNRAATVIRRVLVDREPPVILASTAKVDGAEVEVSATATDNLDLTDLRFRLVFPGSGGVGPIALPFDTATSVVGAAFDGTLTTEASRTARFPLIRTLTTALPGSRATVAVDSVQIQATDATGTSVFRSREVDDGNTPAEDPWATRIIRATLNVAPTRVCSQACEPAEPPARIEMRITGSSGLTQPFARVYFYRRDLATDRVFLLGSILGTAAQGEISGGQAVFRYTLPYSPPAGLVGTYAVFAVGANSAGNAFRSEEKGLEIFER